MAEVLSGLKPEALWKHFEAICNIPHPSRHEKALAEYVISIGKKYNFETSVDDFGNVLVKKPATPGKENLKTVILQGHLDMVPEKNNDTNHDFEKDPIQCYVDGDWVRAKGTTLGSDNGIGVAAGLAVLENTEIAHGPIEILCTLDEETGLFGAQALKSNWLNGDIMLNLDSEEDGALNIGCAGGMNTNASFKIEKVETAAGQAAFKVEIKGLKGGHSGLDIHTGRGNAIKLLNRILKTLDKKFGVGLSEINGGSKHNAIPRESSAIVTVDPSKENDLVQLISELDATLKSEYAATDAGVTVSAAKADLPVNVFAEDFKTRLLNTLYAAPHGVIRMNYDIEGLVQTSTNLGVITTSENSVDVITSQRSSAATEKFDISQAVVSVFTLGGAKVETGDGYPGWNPNIKSPVLGVMKEVFKKQYGKDAEIKAMHAGLECGIIIEKYPELDAISFGPTITGAHSPDEAVQISAVEKFWNLLVATLENIPAK